MQSESTNPKKRRPVKRIIALLLLVVVLVVGIFIYNNFNRLLSEALLKSFDSNIASDVYEIKFEKLRVNIFEGSVRVINVVIQPREKPLRSYPYINSSIRLTTDKLTLMNVQITELLKSNKLIVERISIYKPDIQILFENIKPVFLPFRDSAEVKPHEVVSRKKAIDSFGLDKFQLIDASFHVTNLAKERAFHVLNFSITLDKLLISQEPGRDLLSFSRVDLSLEEFRGKFSNGTPKHVGFKDFKIEIDSLDIRKTIDTLVFHFDNFKAGMKNLDVHTADSLFHLTMQSFDFSYRDKSIVLNDISFKPNISDAAMQDRFRYQHTSISGAAGTVNLIGVNLDSLIYYRSLFIDQIVVDKPELSIFKDNTKLMDMNRFPPYFGQQISSIPIPVRVKEVKMTNVNLVNVERKRDSTYAKVNIRRGTVSVTNITNLSKEKPLVINADAYIEDKVHFNSQLDFSYQKTEFDMSGKLEKFNLPDLNPVLLAYTPAKINAGVADEITFSGTVTQTNSAGTMKFLYHDLEVDLELKNKAKWKSSFIAFAANSIVNSSNPGSENLPPRIVKLQATRDVNKGFVNIIIKSVLSGIKETMIMSKENRKAFHEAKKKFKKEKKGAEK